MAAAELPDLDEHLVDVLTPEGAPSDEDIATATVGDVDEGPGNEAAERVARWTPSDAGAADWAARKAQRAATAISDLRAQRDRIVAQADAWLAHERKRHDATVAWAESMLEVWLRAEIDGDDSKRPRKSRELPCGVTVKQVPGRPRVEVDDAAEFIAWAQDNGLGDVLLRTRDPDPDKQAIKEAATDVLTVVRAGGEDVLDWSRRDDGSLVADTGEVVPGVRVPTGADSYKVETGGGR